jgi:hypothetical protein
MNQIFSSNELLRYVKLTDFKDHKTNKADLIVALDNACQSISKGKFEFKICKRGMIFYVDQLVDILILRKLNDNIKRIYKDEQSNRRIIINQITTLLPDACPFWILRTDIAKFYESVDRDRIYSKLHNDAMLSYFSLWLIKKVFSNPLIELESGLPRGIGISSTLSEIYMRKFDKYVRGCNGVYYYSRFVDDILIFSNHESSLQMIRGEMDNILEEGLKQNKSKTRIFNGSFIEKNNPLEYLGYRFLIKKVGKEPKKVEISIASKKVNKIKTRLVLSFTSYLKDSNIELLEDRIKFLSGNYSIKSGMNNRHDLKAGIYYNYLHINTLSSLEELNVFFHKLLNSKKGSLGMKLAAKLTIADKDRLKVYSFKNGFENKIYHKFRYAEMKEIKMSWLHE